MSKPVFSDLFTFSGRRNRKSYFLFLLALLVAMEVIPFILLPLMPPVVLHSPPGQSQISFGDLGPLFFVEVGIAVLLMWSIAFLLAIAGAQRCRDFGWSGWSVLIIGLPLFGIIFTFMMLFRPGTQGPNRYGPDPLAPSEAAPDPTQALPT